MKYRRKGIIQDAGVIGWISISEVFLLCGVMMLTVALAVESNRVQTQKQLDVVKQGDPEVPGLKLAIEDLRQAKIKDLRTINELTDRLAQADRASEERKIALERLDRELAAASAEEEALRKSVANLTTERGALRKSVATLTTERDEVAATLRIQVAELARSRSENESLRNKQVALQDEINALHKRLIAIDESILVAPKSARLIVKISCDGLPEGYDLDLYVQDPHKAVCSWANPRIVHEETETGLLILSEDFRRLGNTTEEIFYSLNVEPSDAKNPYLVWCMIRSKTPGAKSIPLDIPVRWEISVAWKESIESVARGDKRIKESGDVLYFKSAKAYAYPGLAKLTGFWKPATARVKPTVISEESVPKIFRGWDDQPGGGDSSSVIRTQQ